MALVNERRLKEIEAGVEESIRFLSTTSMADEAMVT